MSNPNHPIENAYLAGLQDGAEDAQEPEGRMDADQLVIHFALLVRAEIFLRHQKPQYLTGYARGARGEKD